jgi:hypothetical protein
MTQFETAVTQERNKDSVSLDFKSKAKLGLTRREEYLKSKVRLVRSKLSL